MQIDVNEANEQHIYSHTMETGETYASLVLSPNQSEHDGEKKVLGILCNLSTDQLVVGLDNIIFAAKELEPSKQVIICLAGKVYDPLGILSPVIIVLKMFLQEMSEARIGWDQLLTGKLLEKWCSGVIFVLICVKQMSLLCHVVVRLEWRRRQSPTDCVDFVMRLPMPSQQYRNSGYFHI